MSQATCKVCQNKIVIRRDGGAGTGEAAPRTPAITPTILSTQPPPQPSTSAATSPFASDALPEQEMSESWREAIVDNRATIDLLKKVGGVPVPDERSTAAGGKALELATPRVPPVPAPATATATPSTTGMQPARAPAPRTDPDRGASAFVAAVASLASFAAAAAIVSEGTWESGLGTLAAIGAAVFAGTACALSALLRRRSFLAVLVIVALAAGAAAVAVAAVFATGGDASHRMIEWHPFLAPLQPFVR